MPEPPSTPGSPPGSGREVESEAAVTGLDDAVEPELGSGLDDDGTGIPGPVRILIVGLFATSMANRAQLVALGFLVFDITGRELDLGLLGLAEFLPVFLLAPFTGVVADRFDRRIIYAVGLVAELAVSLAFLLLATTDLTGIAPILAFVVVFGVARSFTVPASRALPIDLTPSGRVERVVAVRSMSFQTAGIIGPMIAGVLFSVERWLPFAVSIGGFAIALAHIALVPRAQVRRLDSAPGPAQAVRDAIDGLRYIRRTPVLYGAISLDLFAVLFGGAVALLPAIGEKRLGVDEAASGLLYSAVGAGALMTAATLSMWPVRRHVGYVLFAVISVFGAGTVVLGLTRSYAVAVVALFVLGASDAVSVFIRATIVPLASPEEMRGRVLAVENVFIGGSNELGGLESGLTAALFGLSAAVVLGGVGTLTVVGLWMVMFPALRRVNRFEDIRAAPDPGVVR